MNILLLSIGVELSHDGVPLISALMRKEGHTVTLVTMPQRTPLEFSPRDIARLHPFLEQTDLVMISVYTSHAYRAVQITDYVHQAFPGLQVVWGGPHCVSAPEISLLHADGVCFGEGEVCIPLFLEKFSRGNAEYLATPNMGFRVEGKPLINKALPPFMDLDELPFLDYAMADGFVLADEIRPLTRELYRSHAPRYGAGGPALMYLSSRGCPHQCSYCNNCRYVAMFGKNVIRRQSVGRIIAELQSILARLDFFEAISFTDDDFFVRPVKEIEEFAVQYKKSIGVPFSVCFSPNNFRPEKLEPLLDAGLVKVEMGVQSGSARTLTEVYNRNISLKKTRDVVNQLSLYAENRNFELVLDFIIDNPYETAEDVRQTCAFLFSLPHLNKGIGPVFYKLAFYPGTPLFDRAVADGYTHADDARIFLRQELQSPVIYRFDYPTLLLLLYAELGRLRRRIPSTAYRLLCARFTAGVAGALPRWLMRWLIRTLPPAAELFRRKLSRASQQVSA